MFLDMFDWFINSTAQHAWWRNFLFIIYYILFVQSTILPIAQSCWTLLCKAMDGRNLYQPSCAQHRVIPSFSYTPVERNTEPILKLFYGQ